MSAIRAVVRTFKVAGFTAEVSIPSLESGGVSRATVEWTPRVPCIDVDFSAIERATYARFLSEAIASAL